MYEISSMIKNQFNYGIYLLHGVHLLEYIKLKSKPILILITILLYDLYYIENMKILLCEQQQYCDYDGNVSLR